MEESKLDLKIEAKADAAPIRKLDESLKDAEGSAQKLGKSGDAAGDELAEAFERARERIDEAKKRIADDSGAGDVGGGLADGIKKKFAGVDWGELLGKSAAIAAAATTGWEIGEQLSAAIDRVRENGFSWQAIIGPDEAKEAADAAAGALAISFAKIREDHAALVATIERGPAESSSDWLRELDTNARRAADSLRALHEIERAGNKAAVAAINERYANKVDSIEGSDMTDAEKATARSRADVERETALFQQREQERQAEASRRAAEASAAKQRREDTESIAREQERRARMAAEAEQYANANSAMYDDPAARKSQFDSARDNFLNARGFGAGDVGSEAEEKRRLEAARAASEKAAEESRRAALERDAFAASSAIESASDRNTTLGRSRRGLNQASRQAETLNQRDAERAAREQERAEREAAKAGGGDGAAAAEIRTATQKLAKPSGEGEALRAIPELLQTVVERDNARSAELRALAESVKVVKSQLSASRR